MRFGPAYEQRVRLNIRRLGTKTGSAACARISSEHFLKRCESACARSLDVEALDMLSENQRGVLKSLETAFILQHGRLDGITEAFKAAASLSEVGMRDAHCASLRSVHMGVDHASPHPLQL